MLDTPLSDRVARLIEAEKASVAAFMRTDVTTSSDIVAARKLDVDGLQFTLAEIDRLLTEQGF